MRRRAQSEVIQRLAWPGYAFLTLNSLPALENSNKERNARGGGAKSVGSGSWEESVARGWVVLCLILVMSRKSGRMDSTWWEMGGHDGDGNIQFSP